MTYDDGAEPDRATRSSGVTCVPGRGDAEGRRIPAAADPPGTRGACGRRPAVRPRRYR